MEARAQTIPSFPLPEPTTSYWQSPPSKIADYRSSAELPSEADIVIVGSGISGAGVAWNLLYQVEPGQSPLPKERHVVMLEARQTCSGATGRNGGHTKAASYRSFLANMEALGMDEAKKIAMFEYKTISSIQSRAQDIPCDRMGGDTVDIIYDKGQWEKALKSIVAMREAMPEELEKAARYEIFDAEEAKKKFLVEDFESPDGKQIVQGAVKYLGGGLNAYKFVCGVLEDCLERNMDLYTGTEVRSVEKIADVWDGEMAGFCEEPGWLVKTNRGEIRAKQVVLATNGYTGALVKELVGTIVPLRGQVTAQRPGINMPKEGLDTTYSFIYENGYEYMVPHRPAEGTGERWDNWRMVIGGGLVKAKDEGLGEYGVTDDTCLNGIINSYLHDITGKYFGGKDGSWGLDDPRGRCEMEWTGIMGFTPDGFPLVGELEEGGLWICAAFQGHGMVLCWLCAHAMVQMMDGKEFRDGGRLDRLLPRAFRVSKERLGKKFEGRLHLRADEN